MSHLSKRFLRLGLGGFMGLAACVGASAQTGAAEPLDRQSDEAFRQVLQKPQDLGLWSAYAQTLVKEGNYEGGIAALERSLLNPDADPYVRVEIGLLYFRLGSYAAAESMLRAALQDKRLQGDQRKLALALAAEVSKRNQRSQLSGSVVFGLRHQSNPTYRTDSAQVLSAGVLGLLANDQKPDADTDVNLGLRLQHLYDLDLQNSASIVSSLGAYLVNYRSSSGSQLRLGANKPYDLQVLDVSTGLQFKPLPVSLSGLTLRPHILLSNVVAQNHQYLSNQGVGLDLAWRPNERTLIDFTIDHQRRNFANRIDVTNADLLDGHLYGFRSRISHEVGTGQVLTGEYALKRNKTQRAFYSYDSHELRATYAMSYASPLARGGYWTTSFWLGALSRSYEATDASVSPTETRQDREWRAGISHLVPLSPTWSLLFSAEHARNQANLPNFRYKNTTLSGAVVLGF